MSNISVRLFTQQHIGIPQRPTVGHSVDRNNTLGNTNTGNGSSGHQSPQTSSCPSSPVPNRPNKRRHIAHPEDEPSAVASDGNNTSLQNSDGSPIRDGGFEGITTSRNDEGFGDDGPRFEYDVCTTNIINGFPVSQIINRMMGLSQILEALKTTFNLPSPVRMIQMKRMARTKLQ